MSGEYDKDTDNKSRDEPALDRPSGTSRSVMVDQQDSLVRLGESEYENGLNGVLNCPSLV